MAEAQGQQGGGQGAARGGEGTGGAPAPSGGDVRQPDMMPIVDEFPAFVEDPTLGAGVDQDLIMNTLFGGSQGGSESSTGGQGEGKGGDASSGGKPGEGAQGAAAPASGASEGGGGQGGQGSQAAQGADAPAELAPFPGVGAQQRPASAQQPQSPGQGQRPSPQAPAPAGGEQIDPYAGLAPALRLHIQNLEAGNAALQRHVGELMQRSGGQQQGGAQGSGSQSTQQPGSSGGQMPQVEPINLAVPQDVAAAILGDDPNMAQRGMNHLASSLVTVAVQNALQRVPQLIDSRLNEFRAGLQQTTEAERTEQEFYGAFPHLNNELYRPLVSATYTELRTALPHAPWNADFRNALGAKVTEKLKLLGINSEGQQQGPGNGNGSGQQQQQEERGPVARPPAMMGTGTRPAQSSRDAPGDFISRTLG